MGGVNGCGPALTKIGGALLPFPCSGHTDTDEQWRGGGGSGRAVPPKLHHSWWAGNQRAGGGSPWPWGLGKPLQAVFGTGWGVRGWPWGCSEGMRALCPCARLPQLPPAAVLGAQGSIQYCKKFYFLYILLLYLQALTFSKIKALKRRALGCELGSACGTRLTPLRELGPPSAKRSPAAAAAVCSVRTSSSAAGTCPARVGSCPLLGPAGPFPGHAGGNRRVPARGCFLCPRDMPRSPPLV